MYRNCQEVVRVSTDIHFMMEWVDGAHDFSSKQSYLVLMDPGGLFQNNHWDEFSSVQLLIEPSVMCSYISVKSQSQDIKESCIK